MKKIVFFCLSIYFSLTAFAQLPQRISYQAVIRNSDQTLVANKQVTMRVYILQGSITGTPVYIETHSPTSNINGLISIEIGGGAVVSGSFSSIDWANGPYFVQTYTDPNGGTTYSINVTSQLLSVPYAFHAKTAEKVLQTNPENDPIFSGSPASGISLKNVSDWNTKQNKLVAGSNITIINDTIKSSFVEIDSLFSVSVSKGITSTDTANWNASYRILNGGSYGQTLTNCNGIPTWGPCLPIVNTTIVSTITATQANTGGNVVNDGGGSIIARGVVWSTNPNPTVDLSTKTIDGNGGGPFSSLITGLEKSTKYFVRAYATNSKGTSYGAEYNFTTLAQLQIGDIYEGGILAYILQPGDTGYKQGETHGLIISAFDQSVGAEWGCFGVKLPGAEGETVGTGNQNSIDIVNGCSTPGIAAKICTDLVLNGFSDWYLPSIHEIIRICTNKTAIGGFVGQRYWSSTQVDGNKACHLYVPSCGVVSQSYKSDLCRVRAVRSF